MRSYAWEYQHNKFYDCNEHCFVNNVDKFATVKVQGDEDVD